MFYTKTSQLIWQKYILNINVDACIDFFCIWFLKNQAIPILPIVLIFFFKGQLYHLPCLFSHLCCLHFDNDIKVIKNEVTYKSELHFGSTLIWHIELDLLIMHIDVEMSWSNLLRYLEHNFYSILFSL